MLNPTAEGEQGSASQEVLSTPSKPAAQAEVKTPAPVAAAPTTADSTKKTDDVAAAFDDLFNN